MNIDIIIDIPRTFNELWEHREVRDNQDFQINITSLDDLIMLKEFVNREQDKNDVLLLRKIQNESEKTNNEPQIWYDVNNPGLYRNLSVQEVFEWIESTNRFIWNSMTKEQQDKIIQDKLDAGKELFKDYKW